MALFKSASMTSASGSVGGMTYSHNRSGLYMRARRIPVNPNTAFQQDARNALATVSANWRSLAEAEQVNWDAYGAASPVINALGDTIFLTGQQAYVAAASFGQQVANPIANYDTAPGTPGKEAIGLPVVVIDASASTIAITGMTVADTTIVGVFVGSPLSAGRRFFKGPFQLRGFDTPTAGAMTITTASGRNGAPFTAAQRIPVRIRGTAANGRLTTVWEGIVTVVP